MDYKTMQFAINAHRKVNHLYDGNDYSTHLYLVFMYAQKYMNCIPDQCIDIIEKACWLHDTIEDCRLTYNDIKDVAGVDVAEIVYAVTNDKGKSREERANDKYYLGIRNTPWATYVKLCDRIANIKYSKDNHSRMFDVYKKEHLSFLKRLLPDDNYHYKDIISEMEQLLNS